ncbi:MAG TPA: hypothetical protein VFY04_00335 [Solirubrobacterales bacterium]|nr:hypothetical protein [Solirubrobacterales bacterium]
MTPTYAAALAVVAASLAIGQGALAACGVRRWSWLAPPVGLALLCALCWGAVRLSGDGTVGVVVVVSLGLAAAVLLWARSEGGGAGRAALPVALAAAAVASLPFLAEGHFGILGTGFNPDMSQHLLAAARLAEAIDGQLLLQGYPLGPHAVVVALNDGFGIGLVQGFSGLTLAVAVLAPLTALAAFREQPPLRRAAAALLLGLPYLVASYYAQGSFKETTQALFLLAFVLALREASRNPEWRGLPLRFVPAALIAVGSIYVYSFPGLLWLGGALVFWLLLERALPLKPLLLALAVFLVGTLPELGRMIDFQRFETFDPSGPGLGNLFGQLSPFEALGIWPSGDFRLAPGNGAVPAVVYYLGAALGAALLALGILRCWRRRELTIIAGLSAAAGLYLAARVGGTPYTAAKALEIGAPLVTLAILSSAGAGAGGTTPEDALATGRGGGSPAATGPAAARLVLIAYIAVAAGCSLLALANAPVGPTEYSPKLTALRPLIEDDSTLVLAPDRLIDEEQGERYLAWELRGGRVCIERESAADDTSPPGIRFVMTTDSAARPPFPGFELRRPAAPYLLWERRGGATGKSTCPLIAIRQARQGP